MQKDIDRNKFQKVYEMKKTWVEINHLFESSMEHSWMIWNIKDDGL